ncbi:DeoR/GlpR family DNA-binding transcription regulator [Sporosarcina sp. FSL K6-1522]|uniref:DeoR/GlpR family DNA-binding transcription regulator n=1 Tax=Sporosarcina sp. FSL K6-1522 TaxID=2921554 RepID=UPI003159C688
MLVGARQNKIISTVNEHETVRVSELSKLFGVTEETIRRDLEKLEAKGKLMRTHGGAISIKEEEDDLPYFQREVINKKEKMSVAKAAAKYIEEHDIIFLDASSTALYLARLIPNMSLTVLTNSIQICAELAKNTQIRVICTGGALSPNSMSFVGSLTVQNLESYYVDKLFFSCKGIHETWGVSDSNELQALVKQKMIHTADKKYLLLDHTKLNKKAFAHIEKIDAIDVLIIDEGATDTALEPLKERNIKIIKAR